jgi:LacI family transcriptional regulator
MIKHNKPGIKEIARLAGVSIGTVDRALHNRGRVSRETKNRVDEIARKINYRPNLMARSLVINRRHTVALLIPDHHHDEYWLQVLEGAKRNMTKYEQQGLYFEPYFYKLDDRRSFEKSAVQVLDSEPDGVIMAPNFLHEGKSFYERCQSSSIPVIMFDTIIPGTRPLSYIGTDSFQSGRVAAELLAMTARKKGKFAILHFDEELENSPHMLEKERGFLSYINQECPERECMVAILNNKNHYYRDQLKKILTREKISGILVSTSKTYRVGSFIHKENIKGTVLLGYDLTHRNIELLKTGSIRFLIHQNPGRQIEESIQAFYNYLIYNESVMQKILFPIEIITPSNLDSYLSLPSFPEASHLNP